MHKNQLLLVPWTFFGWLLVAGTSYSCPLSVVRGSKLVVTVGQITLILERSRFPHFLGIDCIVMHSHNKGLQQTIINSLEWELHHWV